MLMISSLTLPSMSFQFYISTIIIRSGVTTTLLQAEFQFYISTIIIGTVFFNMKTWVKFQFYISTIIISAVRRLSTSNWIISILHKYDYNDTRCDNSRNAYLISILHKYDYNLRRQVGAMILYQFQFYISTIIILPSKIKGGLGIKTITVAKLILFYDILCRWVVIKKHRGIDILSKLLIIK